VAEATYTVRVAWEPTPSNAFFLDGSALNGTDQLTNKYSDSLDVLTFDVSRFAEPGPVGTNPAGTDTFGSSFDALYSDVSADVQAVTVRRGRDSNLSAFQAGEAVIRLKDLAGEYSPLNTSSPLYPNVVPGRNIFVEATFGTVTYGVFRGFVRSIEYDPAPGARHTTIHAQDLFLYLSRSRPTITNTGTVTTGQAIGTVLTAIDWTETAYRSLGTGDTINAGFANNAESTALELIEGFVETERGEAFHSKDGVFVYRDRYARYKRQSAGTLTNVAAEATAATDLTNIRNRAKVVKTGSGTATWTDYASATNYGFSDYPTIDSPYINTAAQGTALAQWLVAQTKDPSPPVRSLRFVANKTDALMVQALSRDLGDRITVADTSIGGTADFYIEGIDHQIKNGGKLHEVAYSLSKVPTAAPIIFGTSTIYPGSRFDSADVFAF
jgi:hypothetical protein